MAYDERLADRVRDVLEGDPGDGHMACGIAGEELMLRLGSDGAEAALRRPHVRPMDFTGRPMKGMVFVAPQGLRGAALRRWVEAAAAFARTLPPK